MEAVTSMHAGEMLKQDGDKVASMNEEPGSSDQSGGLRILVVEDDPDCAFTAATLLRLCGHNVQIARNGTEAIEFASANKPDVVLLDLGLPRMNGYDVARQLVEERTGKTPLVIAVTGFGQESYRQRSAEAGIDLHLLKPIDQNKLTIMLRNFQKSIQSTPAQRRD
jgi:CheY-like chemotaxis protein